MKKGTELIDEKLSELYTQLDTLGSIREKTAAIKDVTVNLASIGDERVKQVGSALADFSRKTNAVLADVEVCIEKLNKVLVDIKQAPIIEELKGIRENVTTNIKVVGDGVAMVERNLADRIDGLEFETKRLANLLSRNSSEVSNIKRNVNNYAAETKEGLTELDATVRDRTGQLDTKLDEGQGKQSSDIKKIGKSISDDIGGFRNSMTEAVSGCKEAVEVCQKSVKTVRLLVVLTLLSLITFIIAAFPLIKVAWRRYFN